MQRASFEEEEGTWTFGGSQRKSSGGAAKAKAKAKALATPRSSGGFTPPASHAPKVDSATRLAVALQRGAEGLLGRDDKGIGIDIEPVATFADVVAKADFI